MSQIVTEVYDAFRAARVDDDLAKAAAAAIAGRDDLASKLDLERATGRLQTEIVRVETDVRAEIGQIKADLKLLKFGYGPVIIGLLVKLAFFP